MGGVMRPVGPESSETYWLRRALVVGAMLVLLIIVLLFLVNLGGSPGQAAPGAAAPRSASPGIASPTATGPSSGSTRSAGSASPTTSASPSASSSSSPSASRSSSPSGSAHPSATGPGRPTGSASASTAPSRRASSVATAKQSAGHPTAASTAASTARPAACNPEDLRATLRGDRHRVKIGSKVTFRLSLINDSEKSCVITADAKDFELKIYSGTDRIWSSDDCARAVPTVHRSTTPEQAVAWTMSWNGQRSRRGAECVAGPGLPRPGYYYATAQLKGAKPVQFLMVLS